VKPGSRGAWMEAPSRRPGLALNRDGSVLPPLRHGSRQKLEVTSLAFRRSGHATMPARGAATLWQRQPHSGG